MGRELFAELRSVVGPIAMEVRHFWWHLQHLGDRYGSSSSLMDTLMTMLRRFAHDEGHEVNCCFFCAEFRGDMPFQGSPGDRAHFEKWLRRKYGNDEPDGIPGGDRPTRRRGSLDCVAVE